MLSHKPGKKAANEKQDYENDDTIHERDESDES